MASAEMSDILYVPFVWLQKQGLLTYNRDSIPEMIASVESVNSGFCLSDPDDPRHQYIIGIRHRFGDFLHKASMSLRQQGEENTVDAVHMLVSPTTT